MTLGTNLTIVLIALLLQSSCAPPAPQVPPQGAVTAQAAYPPMGAKWQIRRVDNSNGSAQELTMTAMPIDYAGAARYGISNGTDVSVNDPATFNEIARLQNGKLTSTSTPDNGTFSWPLWVGRSWTPSYAYHDVTRGRSWDPVQSFCQATAYEDVTVPAGAYKAFKIECQPGTNDAAYRTYWYAPDLKLIVKYIFQRTSSHYLGSGTFTTELLTVPQ